MLLQAASIVGGPIPFGISVLPKSARLQNVKAYKAMLLIPAEHGAPGSLEVCHGVIALTM